MAIVRKMSRYETFLLRVSSYIVAIKFFVQYAHQTISVVIDRRVEMKRAIKICFRGDGGSLG